MNSESVVFSGIFWARYLIYVNCNTNLVIIIMTVTIFTNFLNNLRKYLTQRAQCPGRCIGKNMISFPFVSITGVMFLLLTVGIVNVSMNPIFRVDNFAKLAFTIWMENKILNNKLLVNKTQLSWYKPDLFHTDWSSFLGFLFPNVVKQMRILKSKHSVSQIKKNK